MKVCYVDESGADSKDPCLVMVGIVADASRLGKSNEEFGGIFAKVQALFEENFAELKGAKMIFGRARWRKIDPERRKEIAVTLCEWVVRRKHDLVISAVDRSLFAKNPGPGLPKNEEWIAAALHIALQVQKAHQGMERGKGRTFLIFDENKMFADHVSDLLYAPPPWTFEYYGCNRPGDAFSEVIDSSFTVKSHHAGLVQIADLYAFVLRRFAEMAQYGLAEEWAGERGFIEELVGILRPRMLDRSFRYPQRGGGDCAAWFRSMAPEVLVKL